jgi:predicted Zn-dependent peptidase
MFKKEKLENGMTVVMEQVRNVRSVSLGIWVKVGSRNESTEKSGISHFLEHMYFKGTKKRTAREIAFDIDSIGGDLNAFTSRENTAFYIKVLDEHIEKGVELLTDIFRHSMLPVEDIEKEKGVIIEEIKMVEDTPDDYIHDLFNISVWGMKGLGQPVLGRRETVKGITRDDLVSHIRKYYGVMDTIVSCAGNFEEEKLLRMLNETLGTLRRGSELRVGHPPVFNPSVSVHGKDISEVNICMGVEGLPQSSRHKYSFSILNSILGAGISSRLFQEIREMRGLAYTIYSFISSYKDTGVWGVYAGTGSKKLDLVLELIMKDMKALPDNVSDSELQRAKDQLKGSLMLSLESTSGRMHSIAKQEIYYGRYYSPHDIIADIDAVNIRDIKEVAGMLIKGKAAALTVLGPVDDGHLRGTSLLL